jgi:sucrose phosphorylase
LTYPDSLGGDLAAVNRLLDGPLAGLFRGVHVLPPFPSTGDRGFAPVTYERIEPAFGTWRDIEAIAEHHDVLLDVMVNHISRRSEQFADFERNGRRSQWADLFITVDKVWAAGVAPPDDLARIALRKPDSPLSPITITATGAVEQVWTSFGTSEWAEQIDLDVNTPATRALITGWLRTLAAHRVRLVRLDAVGYVTKRAGTNCFMVEPEIWHFLDWITDVADGLGLVLLPEVHDRYDTHRRLSARGYWTYDFVLPGLVLDALHRADASALTAHLDGSPSRQFTTLDCHDGIPVRPDLDGVLEPARLVDLTERSVARGGNVNRLLSTTAPGELDVHQINCSYYSALDHDDDRYLAARAIQLFARGVPQIYYVGLLAGSNDEDAVRRSGDGRSVNRHDFSVDEVLTALDRPVVRRLLDLVRLRNTHPAFDGDATFGHSGSRLNVVWTNGTSSCTLDVDLASGRIDVGTH